MEMGGSLPQSVAQPPQPPDRDSHLTSSSRCRFHDDDEITTLHARTLDRIDLPIARLQHAAERVLFCIPLPPCRPALRLRSSPTAPPFQPPPILLPAASNHLAWPRRQVRSFIPPNTSLLTGLFSFDADGLKSVGKLAQSANPGTYVYNIRLSNDSAEDKKATYLGDLNEQVATVCTALRNHTILSSAPAVNAMGFSQGGQFLRAYVERCNEPPVASLVTFGAQHNGIASFAGCDAGDWLCMAWDGLLRTQTWGDWVQHNLIPAQYFRDPEDLDPYLESSNFLADVNNEREVKNETYKENLKKLERLVLYVFAEDTTVVPRLSGWFYETNKTSGAITKLKDRALYKEDWLGLKDLDERGRLEFRELEGGHMRLTEKALLDAFKRYFSPKAGGEGELGAVHLGL